MNKLAKLLKKLSNANVLVLGDLILDHYIWGKVERISPEAPVPVVKVTKESFMAGGSANVALNIRALSGNVSVCGIVGKDQFGKKLLNILEKNGINKLGVFVDSEMETIRKTRVIAHHQHVVRVDREQPVVVSKKILKNLEEFLADKKDVFNVVIISDYAKGFINESIVGLMRRIFDKSLYLADPKVKNMKLFYHFDLVTPNRKEAMEAAGIADNGKDDDILKAGTKLLKTYKFKNLLITRGEEGMSLFTNGKHIRIPTFAQEVFDVTGAGDTVIAAVGTALSAGIPLVKSCIIANLAASVVVGKVGTATATIEEVEDKWNKLDTNIKKQLEHYL
jgi:rfaE bifunctional protein kinase chain/domain